MKIKDKDNVAYLPVIIPILFYHGESKKNIKKRFGEYFKNGDQFRMFLPSFEVLFYDFSLKGNTSILGDFKLQYALKLMKMIKSDKIKLIYREIKDYIVKLENVDQEFLFQGIKYIFEVQEEFDVKAFAKSLKKQGIKEGDLLMTMAEKLRQEGRQEGKIEIVINMLKSGMDIEQIIKLTELDEEKVRLLKDEIQH